MFCTHCGNKLEQNPEGAVQGKQSTTKEEACVQNSVQKMPRSSGNTNPNADNQKKKTKPYFFIGAAAVLLSVLLGVFVFKNIFLSMGLSPKQKFLKYQAEFLEENIKQMEEWGLFPLREKQDFTFTITGDVKGNDEISKYLKDSAIVVKTKSNPEQGNFQGSMKFKLMGSDVLDAYGEYENGNIGFAFPSMENSFYKGKLKSILANSLDEDESIELPNPQKYKESKQIAERLLKKYGSLLSEFITKDNFTVKKEEYTLPYLGDNFNEKEFKGTIYTFKPGAKDIEKFLEKFADILEKDKVCQHFLSQSGLGNLILSEMYYNELFNERYLANFSEWLRENAEDIGEQWEEDNFYWELAVEGKKVHKIHIGTDIEEDDKLNYYEGDRNFLLFEEMKQGAEGSLRLNISLDGDMSLLGVKNSYIEKGKTMEGTISIFNSHITSSTLKNIEYSIEKGKKNSLLPYGTYTVEDMDEEGANAKLTVAAGKNKSTDYALTLSDVSDWKANDVQLAKININVKNTADITRPKEKSINISDYSLDEVYHLGENFSYELSNAFAKVFNR